MRTAAALALALLVAAFLCGREAFAAGADADAAIEAIVERGRIAEEAGDFARALREDRAAAAAAPDSRTGSLAAARATWLEHRAEGAFAPLARLERVRRDPALADDPAALEALARDADAFPPGPVRSEARFVVAEAWLGRLRRADDALALLRSIADDPYADADLAHLAEHRIIATWLDDGRIRDAAREAEAHAGLVDAPLAARVRRLVRRRIARWAASAAIALLALTAGVACIGAARRRALSQAARAVVGVAPAALGVAAYAAVVGGALATTYEGGRGAPFVALGAAVLPLALLARAWSAVGSNGRAARLARAAVCGAATIAAGFLVLEGIDPTYLEGFGL
jgi:hypothetical protein